MEENEVLCPWFKTSCRKEKCLAYRLIGISLSPWCDAMKLALQEDERK